MFCKMQEIIKIIKINIRELRSLERNSIKWLVNELLSPIFIYIYFSFIVPRFCVIF